MHILFQSRKTLHSVPGGDTVQILKTQEHLRKLGIRVEVSTELEPEVGSYDLVHIFNLMRPQEAYLQARNAKRRKKPVALSTIYGLYTEYDQRARTGLAGFAGSLLDVERIEYLKIAARTLLNGEVHAGTCHLLAKGYRALQKEICGMTDVFLPNSEAEMRRVAADMGLTDYRYHVVPNAVDHMLFDAERVGSLEEAEAHKGCILCVARIEGRKNQLNLVRAVKDLPWKLVLIGQPAPNHQAYYRKVAAEAGTAVTLLGQVPHERLPLYYKAANVHVLASWMETPGLSSLEAAAMGCRIVVTDKGDAREYFGAHARFCDPASVASIRDAIKEAYASPEDDILRTLVRSRYSWSIAAQRTLDAYSAVVNK